MKRRERDNARKAQSRQWYFARIDWIISEEIEDDEKGKKNYQKLFIPYSLGHQLDQKVLSDYTCLEKL